jgi:hypothetical protein
MIWPKKKGALPGRCCAREQAAVGTGQKFGPTTQFRFFLFPEANFDAF